MGRFAASEFLLLFIACIYSSDTTYQVVQNSLIPDVLPSCILGVKDIDFFMYNANEPNGQILDLESGKIPLVVGRPVMFLVHGFTSEANNTRYINLTDIWVTKYNYNVFSVDWRKGACSGGITLTQFLSYPSAVQNTKVVGQAVAKFIIRLTRELSVPLANVTLIGHSLGAHVASFAGKELQKQGTGTIPQLWALDPAGPGFEYTPCSERVCETDAKFVQVFHTSFVAGMHREVGDDDFYFNGGVNQPGCPALETVTCSHSAAIGYLIAIYQMSDCKFIGRRWNRFDSSPPTPTCETKTCSVPGPDAVKCAARGSFYVDTTELPSECKSKLVEDLRID